MTAPQSPTRTQIRAAWQDLQRIHRTHLAQHKVKLPEEGTAKALWLGVLWACRDRPVHKAEMSAIAQRELGGPPVDQQVRHLKRDGWNIVPVKRGEHQLADPYQPSPEYANAQARRQGQLNAATFDDLKRAFDHRCATCGAVEGEPDPRYGRDRVQLQQGHRDPSKPAADRLNIIPQCQFCNRQYRDDFVFDEKGRAHAIAGLGPVRRASREVQRKAWEFLKEKFDN